MVLVLPWDRWQFGAGLSTKVKDILFMEAVERIMGQVAVQPPVFVSTPKQEKPKTLLLPRASRCATHAVNYLARRGIDPELIDFCIQTGRLYESEPYHNRPLAKIKGSK